MSQKGRAEFMRLKFIVCRDRKSVCHQVTNGSDSLSLVRCQLLAPGTLPLSSDPLLYWVLMSFILFFSAKYLWKGTLSEFTLSEILSIAGLYVKSILNRWAKSCRRGIWILHPMLLTSDRRGSHYDQLTFEEPLVVRSNSSWLWDQGGSRGPGRQKQIEA